MVKLLKKEKVSSFAEFRQSPLTKRWVLVNPGRARRPEEFFQLKRKKKISRKETCPFCKGNEAKYAPVSLLELYLPKHKEWAVRVVPNKYPAVLEEKIDLTPETIDRYHKRQPAVGSHEILITEDHQDYTAKMELVMVDKMLEAYQIRIQELRKNKDIKYVIIFQNQGAEAGASVVHPHSQLIALNHIPPHPQSELLNSRHYFENHKTCLVCDLMKLERRLKRRIVMESENFVVHTPYASRFPFKVWLLPKKHSGSFDELNAKLRFELSKILKKYLVLLDKKLGKPAYNYYLHTLPVNGRYSKEKDSYHWHFTIFPKINTWGGFEYGSGTTINEIPPEMACHFLRSR